MAKETFEKTIYNVLDMLIRPEKCVYCEEWMRVHLICYDKHEVLERRCTCEKSQKEGEDYA